MRQSNKKEEYIVKNFPCQDPILTEIKHSLYEDRMDGIQIGEIEARFLQFLIKTHGVRSIVEIGTLYGFSTLAMAQALPENGKIYSLDLSPKHHEKAHFFLQKSPHWPRIELLTGDAKQSLSGLEEKGPFDLVFIDADKSSYLHYLDWAEQHTRTGSLIIGDNTLLFDTLWGGDRGIEVSPQSQKVMTEFNRRLADQQNYNSVLIPTAEGLTVGIRN
ncbi:MAG: O-methyltransferase [Bdellovibrionales bacterium]|nr:O-methyltransferase [Bdellovibrionales bacterium]